MDTIPYHCAATIKANGIDIHFDSFGDKTHPPVLLIMGLATQMIHWDEDFCRSLAAKGYWVIRFDNRDIGRSEKLDHLETPSIPALVAKQWFKRAVTPPYLLNDMAQDAFGLMDTLDIEKAHIVGVSMGGMIAQSMALMHPERIRTLTSIMSTTGDHSLPKPDKSVIFQLIKPMPKDENGFVKQTMKLWNLLHGKRYTFEADRVEGLVRQARARSYHPSGILRQFCAIMLSPDRTKKLASLKIPTLVLHGDADPLVLVECGKATAAAIPDAKLKIYEGMGHTLPRQLWDDMISEVCLLAESAQ